MKRSLFVLSASLLSVVLIISACSNSSNTGEESVGNSSANEPAKRETLTMIMSNSGVDTPDSIDPSDNPFINIIEDYANVDLTVEVPPYQDFQSRFNLVMSSGNLPDIVHTYYSEVAEKAGDEGAFLDLKEYYDNSPMVQQWITPEMMEFAKSKVSGSYYRIPNSYVAGYKGLFNFVNYEFLEQFNDGKFPASIEEYIEVFRRMKQADPNSYPITNRVVGTAGLGYAGNVLYYWYGAVPFDYRVQNGKVLSTFTLPEYRAATELMRRMYNEGILDVEFATVTGEQYSRSLVNGKALLENNWAIELIWRQISGTWGGGLLEGKKFVIAPPLTKYPDVLSDPKYVLAKAPSPIGNHGLYISANTKNPDLAWKVIEGFASNELFEAVWWGKEGSEYTIENGERVPIPEKMQSPDRSYSLQYSIIPGFSAGNDIEKAQVRLKYDEEYYKLLFETIDASQELMKNASRSLIPFAPPSEDINKKKGEEESFITQATVEAIMGRITMEQFDQRVQEFQNSFGFIYDYYTDFLTKNKAMLLDFGVTEAGW